MLNLKSRSIEAVKSLDVMVDITTDSKFLFSLNRGRRIINISGVFGVGKTTLAVRLGLEYLGISIDEITEESDIPDFTMFDLMCGHSTYNEVIAYLNDVKASRNKAVCLIDECQVLTIFEQKELAKCLNDIESDILVIFCSANKDVLQEDLSVLCSARIEVLLPEKGTWTSLLEFNCRSRGRLCTDVGIQTIIEHSKSPREATRILDSILALEDCVVTEKLVLDFLGLDKE